jgi:alpha-D-xyloside xylohydrolase
LIDDQFLVGSHILQAPFVKENQYEREVVLPGTEAWYEPMEGRWHAGNQKIIAIAAPMTTPFYIRDGAVLPMARLQPEEHRFDGLCVDFRVVLSEEKKTSLTYLADDGISFEYSSGKESSLELTFHRKGTTLAIHQDEKSSHAGKIDPTFTTETAIQHVLINGRRAKRLPAQGVALGKEKTKTWQ